MNFNTIAIYSLLAASSGADAAFLRSGAGLGVGGGCQEGQIKVVNNCGATLKHCDGKGLTTTLQPGCQDLPGAGERIWVGSDDSTCYTSGNTLFEYTYDSRLSWDVSLLSGYNYPVKVENNGKTLLDVTGPSCGSVKGGLFPCAQLDNACAQWSTIWPNCDGCSDSCCDMRDSHHDCNPPPIESTQNMVLTFCPNQESFSLDADAFIERESESNTLNLKRTALDRVKNEGVYLASDAAATLDVTVTANVDALPKCVNEDHPVTVFYTADDKKDLSPNETSTHPITQDGSGLHFGIQVNDWYWRSNPNPSTKQWADNAGMEVIIKDAATCDFELKPSWGNPNAPDARDVLDLTKTSVSGGCSFTVTRKADPSLHITKDCVGPCIPNPTKYQLPWQPGCDCTTGGSTVNCPTEN